MGLSHKITIFDSEIMNTQFTYQKDKLKKWLLTVTLLFSIFTFSGYASNQQSREQHTTQTELVISSNHKTCKRTVSYKKAFDLTSSSDFLINPYKSWTNALFTHKIITKVKLDSLSRQFYSHKSAAQFLQVKTIPQSSDEDIFATFIG